MDAPATPYPFRIATDGRAGSIEVDGRNLTDSVAAVAFDLGHGEPARLTLQMLDGQHGVLDGLAVIQVMGAGPSGDVVRSFDLDEVQGRLAARPVDLSTNLVQTVLDIVAEMLDEASA